MKINFNQEVKMLVEYIKEHSTKTSPWVAITHRQVSDITGASPYYTNKIFEKLRHINSVTYRLATDHSTSKKPFKFRIIDPEHKKEEVFHEKDYRQIAPNQLELLKEKISDHDGIQISMMLKTIDYLLGKNANNEFYTVDLKKTSRILTIDPVDLEEFLIIFTILKIAEIKRKEIKPDCMDIRLNLPHGTSTRLEEKPLIILPTMSQPEKTISEDHETESYKTLIENMNGFGKIINEFKMFVDEKTDHVIDRMNNIESSYETTKKLIEETEEWKDKVNELGKENQRLEKENQMLVEFRDKFESTAQVSLEIMLGTITNSFSEYVRVPAWQKDEKSNAKLQHEINTAMMNAMEEILGK